MSDALLRRAHKRIGGVGLRDWIDMQYESPSIEHDAGAVMRVAATGYRNALDDLSAWLDEHEDTPPEPEKTATRRKEAP